MLAAAGEIAVNAARVAMTSTDAAATPTWRLRRVPRTTEGEGAVMAPMIGGAGASVAAVLAYCALPTIGGGWGGPVPMIECREHPGPPG